MPIGRCGMNRSRSVAVCWLRNRNGSASNDRLECFVEVRRTGAATELAEFASGFTILRRSRGEN